MKVIWPCHWYGDYRVPVFKHLNELLGGGLMVYYSKPDVTESVDRKMREQLPNNSVGLVGKTIVLGSDKSTFANKALFLRFQPDLYKRLKEYNPDIVIAETFGGWSPIAILYAIMHKKKLMMFYERTAHVERNSPWWRTLYRKIMGKSVKHFLINGIETEKYLNILGFNKIPKTKGLMVSDATGLKNAVQSLTLKDKTDLREKLKIRNGLTYLFVGQIVERKGIIELCQAWCKHVEKYRDDNMLIVGTGPLLSTLQEQYKNLDSLKFIGRVEYDMIHKYYGIADVFFMPTLEDNWCLVVPEAMTCGLPVACSIYNGGTTELIKDGENGYSFDPLDRNSMIETLGRFHKVDLQSMGKTSKTIVNQFTPEIAAKKIYLACKNLINPQ